MPLYDYECGSCGAEVEKFTKQDERTPPCDGCGEPMKRIPNIGFAYQWFQPQHFDCVGHHCETQQQLYESAKRQGITLHR